MVGLKLLHYEIVAHLGAGGMGGVWRARDTRLDREVAIKILPGDQVAPAQQERFLREAQAVSSLVHPNIITIHEINSAAGVDFIVMEYVRGEPLSTVLAGGRLPIEEAVGYAVQTADALAAAHDAGVVHRDLKPGNIMIAAGRVKVVDFGIAKRLADAAGEGDRTTAAALTVAGMTVGTPAYMSPEQTLGDPVDARSDLFSLGVVLYEMLTGRRPFQATSTLSLVRQIVHDSPKPIRESAPDVPKALAAVVDRCLAKDPTGRYQDASEVARALRQIAPSLPNQSTAAELPRTRTEAWLPFASLRAWSRKSWATGLLAAGLLVVLAWSVGPRLARWVRIQTTAGTELADADASPHELYRRATENLRVYYREGNVDKAIDQLNRALQLRSSYPLAEARLSLAYWRKNAISPDAQWNKQAMAHADRAVSGDGQLAVAHLAQGAAFFASSEIEKASAAYDRAFTLEPGNWDLLWRLGELAGQRKQIDQAEEFYSRAVSAGKTEWEPYARLGGFYYRQGRYADALDVFQKLRDLAPDNARAHSNLAAVYHQLGRTDEAAAVLQRSLEIAPDSITYSNLGTYLYFQGKYPEAVSALERSVALGANTYLRWGNLGDAVRMTSPGSDKMHESYRRAIQLAEERLSKTPGDVDARSSVALYLIRDGHRQKALAELDAVLAQPKLPPAVLFKAGLVAELALQRARALDLLGQALAAGYQLREIREEPDLVKLRADAEYHKLASRYEK